MSDALCDHRRQQDEISALESIFSADEIKRSEEHGPSAGQFYANIEVPTGVRVVTKHWESKMEEVLEVSFLPPIVLHYSLPEQYPSNPSSPPSFTLTCHWLNRAQLSKLCKKLDFLWQENHVDGQGSEILFTWAHFLKNESLEFLKIQDQLDVSAIENLYYCRYLTRQRKSTCNVTLDTEECGSLGNVEVESNTQDLKPTNQQWVVKEPSGGNSVWTCFQRTPVKKIENSTTTSQKKSESALASRLLDCRAVMDLTPNVSILDFLSSFNEAQEKVDFCRQPHLCNVCFDTKLGYHFTRFYPCNHILCSECARQYFSTTIEGGKVQNIYCPEEKCNSEAQFNQIKEHLSPELFLRYDRMLLDATLATLGDIIPCPRPTCQYSVTIEGGDDKLATCFHCRYAFCVDCRMGYHGVEPCRFKADEEHKLVEEYRDASEQRRTELEKRYSKRRLEELVQNSMTREWIEDNSKKCPHCNASIQKSFGCNKMVCLKCDTHFCWLCAVKLDPKFPYLHFNKPGSRCYNLLFQGVDVDDDGDDFLDVLEAEWFEEEMLELQNR